MAVQVGHLRYALAATALVTGNSTSADFTALTATTTAPSGAGVVDLGAVPFGSPAYVPSYVLLMPFGVGAANTTFSMRLQGYSLTLPTTGLLEPVATGVIYIPQLLVEVAVTLSANTFTDYGTTTALADVLTIAAGAGAADNGSWRSLVSADIVVNTPGSIIVHTRGCRYLKWDWDLGTATSMNCLWRPFDF